MKVILFCLVIIVVFGCTTEEDVFGVYVKHPTKYTIDSLFLYDLISPNGSDRNFQAYMYKQRFYNKSNGELLFENDGIW